MAIQKKKASETPVPASAVTLDGETVSATGVAETGGNGAERAPRGPSFRWKGGSNPSARYVELKRAMKLFEQGKVTAENGNPQPLTLSNLRAYLLAHSGEFAGQDELLTELKLGQFIRSARESIADRNKKGANIAPLPSLVVVRTGPKSEPIDWSAE